MRSNAISPLVALLLATVVALTNADSCPADITTEVCALPSDAFKYSVVTFGDATIAAHSMYKGIAIAGTLYDGSPQESGTVDSTKSYIKSIDSRCSFNFNGGKQTGKSCFADKLYDRLNYIATHAQNSTNVTVCSHEGTYNVDHFVPGGEGNDDGYNLAVFTTTGTIYISDSGGRQFGPTILAPNAKVVINNNAGYVDGSIYAREIYSQDGSLQLHGDTFHGTIVCGDGSASRSSGSTGCDSLPSFAETYKGLPAESFSNNPNCQDLGYDYGYKMDENCYSGSNIPFGVEDETLNYAKTQGTCSSGTTPSGTFDLTCSTPDGNQFIDATITPSVDTVVIMKGGNGGVVYDGLKAGETYTLDVGQRKGISHIEFCFRCDGHCPSQEVTPTSTPTAAPTEGQSGGYCNYNGCNGVPSGGNWCNIQKSNCEGNCNGEWCVDVPTSSPTQAPTGTPGYCNYNGCNGNPAGGPWCNIQQANCEGNCNGEWCTYESPTSSPTDLPTAGPTTSPTSTPTSSPTESPSEPPQPPAPDGPTNEDTTTDNGFVKGDPHFKTFGGELYDYHGECDLVFLHNPDFKNGLGMDIHIRTKIENFWSSVESAAIRIGDATMEVKANAGGDEWLWINGELVRPEDGKWHHADLSGFMIRFKETGPAVREANVYLERGHKEVISFKTFKSFVRIDVNWKGSKNYDNSLGLLGSHAHDGKRLARDGKTFIKGFNKFGQEWQVLDSEPKLFHSYEGAVVGRKCVMPPTYTTATLRNLRLRRLSESNLTEADAEKACQHLGDPEERKSCVFDVIATQDLSMASVW